MQRRSFIKQSVLWTAGCAVGSRMSLWGAVSATGEVKGTVLRSGELYKLFRGPQDIKFYNKLIYYILYNI